MPRYVKKQTIFEFKTFIAALADKNDMERLDYYGKPVTVEQMLHDLVMSPSEFVGTVKVEKDLYETRYVENGDFPTESELESNEDVPEHFYYRSIQCAGFQTLDGVTFYGGFLSSDWTEPWFVAFYQDNKGQLRGYVPKKGNGFNPLSKVEFRRDSDLDDKYARSKGFKDFNDMQERYPEFMLELYDTELIKQDVLKRLVVK